MTLHLRAETLFMPYREPFRIAREPVSLGATTVVVELTDDRYPDLVGLGEGPPETYYGETSATMSAAFPTLLEAIGEPELTADGLVAASLAMDAALRWNGAAKCAIDTALHDLAGKIQGLPVHALLGLSPDLPPTDMTIGMDEPSVVADRAARAGHFPALKIKLGSPDDLAILEAVRSVYAGPIRVDANTGWDQDTALGLIADLERLGVELIEQPFPARRLDQLRWLQERTSLPVVADESAFMIEDLEGLVGVVAGINVKIAKCGGVGPAKRMLERAHELGFKTFLGCMGESSIAIAAGAAVASLADWVDLDSNLFLVNDPYEGLKLDPDCRWRLSLDPGLGVRPVAV